MTRRNRLKMDPTKTPETDLEGFQEQGGYAPDPEDIKQEQADVRKQYQKNRQANKAAKRNRKQSNDARQREWDRQKERGEVFGEMPKDWKLYFKDSIKDLAKYGLPIKSTYSGITQAGMTGLKYLLYNQLR